MKADIESVPRFEEAVSTVNASYVASSATKPLAPGTKIGQLFMLNMTQPYFLQRLTERTYFFAGNQHDGFEVEGAGNQLTVRLVRQSQRKRGESDGPNLPSMAPVLDPTTNPAGSRIVLTELETDTTKNSGCQQMSLTLRIACGVALPSEKLKKTPAPEEARLTMWESRLGSVTS